VPLHNAIDLNGPQWATHGADDHIDDVHLFALNGNTDKGDKNCLVFQHDDFRAVIVPKQNIDLVRFDRTSFGQLQQVQTYDATGFVGPALNEAACQRQMGRWIKQAPHSRDARLKNFLENPAKRYPVQRPYDGPQPATIVNVDLPRIDEFGMY
jgi:hypothetical protein